MSNQEHQPRQSAESAPRPRNRRGFFSQVFSHLMVALIAVTAVVSYIFWDDILNYAGSDGKKYNVLGNYVGLPLKIPSIDLTNLTPSISENAGAAIAKPEQVPSFAQALDAARKLFWAESPATVDAYKKLIATNPEDADLQAELGNVYFKMGQKNQAANQYLEAGRLYGKQKKSAKVAAMAKILEKIAPKKARMLVSGNIKANQ